MRSALPHYLWIFLALPACATFEQSAPNGGSGGVGSDTPIMDGGAIVGVSGSNPVGSGAGEGQSGGSSTGGVSNAGSSSGAVGGTAGAAVTSSGGAGMGVNSPNGDTGGASAAGASAGASAAGASAAGASAAGGSSINPCDRTNWKASASESSLTMPNLYNPPSCAIDGVTSTRWSSGAPPTGGEWFLVDLGAKAAHLTKVVLDTTDSTGDIPPAYKLELSLDNAKYTQVATGAGADRTTITFVDTPARYIKVTQTQSSTATQGHWWSIHELTLACTP